MLKATIFGILMLVTQATLFAVPYPKTSTPPLSSPEHPQFEASPNTPPIVIERTLTIVKPDAVNANNIGSIIAIFEKAGLHVIALKMTHLTQAQAQQFYNIHKERPFFGDLVKFMSSGPIVAMVLEGEQAVAKSREIIGATDPKIAAPGTIRAEFAKSKTENAIHGSDSLENAKTEISFFFKPQEIFSH